MAGFCYGCCLIVGTCLLCVVFIQTVSTGSLLLLLSHGWGMAHPKVFIQTLSTGSILLWLLSNRWTVLAVTSLFKQSYDCCLIVQACPTVRSLFKHSLQEAFYNGYCLLVVACSTVWSFIEQLQPTWSQLGLTWRELENNFHVVCFSCDALSACNLACSGTSHPRCLRIWMSAPVSVPNMGGPKLYRCKCLCLQRRMPQRCH